jgi:hypothetical protein
MVTIGLLPLDKRSFASLRPPERLKLRVGIVEKDQSERKPTQVYGSTLHLRE